MDNALSYLDWRGDLTFEVSKFNEVDLFLCSQISTIDFSRDTKYDENLYQLKDAAKAFLSVKKNREKTSSIGTLQSDAILPMIEKIGETVRFSDIRIWNPVTVISNEKELQFSAVTIVFPNNRVVVSYRGTDDTIIGWKEDFNIAALDEVPAQALAEEYLEYTAQKFPDSVLCTCGHSKGGNLAIYAAACADKATQERIETVVSFDGPGFQKKMLKKAGYKRIADRTYTVISENSIVGLLLEQAGTVVYVQTDIVGPYAHDGFNWKVMGTQFVRSDGLGDSSQRIKNVIAGTLGSMDNKERLEFIDSLFDDILSTGAETVTELVEMPTYLKYQLFRKLLSNKTVGKFISEIGENYFKELFPSYYASAVSTEKRLENLWNHGKSSIGSLHKYAGKRKKEKT